MCLPLLINCGSPGLCFRLDTPCFGGWAQMRWIESEEKYKITHQANYSACKWTNKCNSYMVLGTGPWLTSPRTFFSCNADLKDKGNFTIEREVETWLLRAVREESQINPLAKKVRLKTAFKGPLAFHETWCLTLHPGSASEWEVLVISLLCSGKRGLIEWLLPTALQITVV